MNKLMAIDPGASGGIAWMDGAGKVACLPMPDTQGDILALMRAIQSDLKLFTCYMEKVGGYIAGKGCPGSAMFNFGRGYGHLEGVLTCMMVPVIEVTPQAWQKSLGLGTSKGMTKTQWKNKLKGAAQKLFPDQKVTLATADALLILEHARRAER